MSKYTEKDAAKDTDSKAEEVEKAWHTARQDAATEQIRTGENWGLPDNYAVHKVIQAVKEKDAENGESGK